MVAGNPFSEARKFLWNGQGRETRQYERYTCHALLRACDAGLIEAAPYCQAAKMIRNRLGEYKFVEAWLCNEAGIRLSAMTPEAVQGYRFSWLKELEQLWNQGERT